VEVELHGLALLDLHLVVFLFNLNLRCWIISVCNVGYTPSPSSQSRRQDQDKYE
jgi:hypothetical protein